MKSAHRTARPRFGTVGLHRRVAVGAALALLAGAALVASAFEESDTEGEKRALLIGIDRYEFRRNESAPAWLRDVRPLRGAVHDVRLLEQLLTGRFGFRGRNIITIEDRQATRRGIERGFETLIRTTRPGDMVYVHYSGHGSTVPNVNRDDENPRDGTWVPIDADKSLQIIDDEIRLWIARLLTITPDVILVSDSCHSGTITRGEDTLQARGLGLDDPRDYSSLVDPQTIERAEAALRDKPQRFIRLSAAQQEQQAWEFASPDRGKIHGRLTWHWAEALRTAERGATYQQLFTRLEALFSRRAAGTPEQTPVAETRPEPARSAELFRSEFTELRRGLAVVSVGDEIGFHGGLLSGVTQGSIYESRSSGKPTRVEITRLEPMRAYGTVIEGGPVAENQLFEELERAYQYEPISVRVLPDDPPRAMAWGNRIEARIRDTAGLSLESSGPVDLIVRIVHGPEQAKPGTPEPDFCEQAARAGGTWACLLDGHEQTYGSGTLAPEFLRHRLENGDGESTGKRAALDALAAALADLVHRSHVLELARRFAGDVPDTRVELLDVVHPTGKQSGPLIERWLGRNCPQRDDELGLRARRLGELIAADSQARGIADRWIAFRAVNHSVLPLYFYVLNVRPQGDVKVRYPRERGSQQPVPGKHDEPTSKCLVGLRLSDLDLTDSYVVIASREPVDVWGLETVRKLTRASEPQPEAGDPVERLLARLGRPRTRDGYGKSQPFGTMSVGIEVRAGEGGQR